MNIFQKVFYFFTGNHNADATALEVEAELTQFGEKTLSEVVNEKVSEQTKLVNEQLETIKATANDVTAQLTALKADLEAAKLANVELNSSVEALKTEKAQLQSDVEAKQTELNTQLEIVKAEQVKATKLENELLEAKAKAVLPEGQPLPNRNEMAKNETPKGAVQFS